jgi:hypothetical protein
MKKSTATVILSLAAFLTAALLTAIEGVAQPTLQSQNEQLFTQVKAVLGLNDEQMTKIRSIFAGSDSMSQGNPAVTRHPLTPQECKARAESAGKSFENPRFEKICGSKYMAPLYDPATQQPEDAKACIDQFEFPNMPCTYPVVWVKAREAEQICEAQGKRMCDAHEWEGACAGRLTPPDYDFALVKGLSGGAAFNVMRSAHNRRHANDKSWSYGPDFRTGVCAQNSTKSASCNGGQWSTCGSNTYPTGSFATCKSALGVYDLNGNAAEHMNLPTRPEEMTSQGSKTLGYTEMKGSWFIWDKYRAHEDWCRWRAPYWHGSKVMDPGSHANYHLSFRCCKTTH